MAPHSAKPAEPLTPDEPTTPAEPIGPQSGIFSIPTQYISEQSLRHSLRSINSEDHRIYDESLEDKYRLKGVQLIDKVRTSLQLPVKTFGTAATYYHKFRIRFPSSEYNYEDAALASLFVACKVEDTLKKSKEILSAAHNIRQPHDSKSSDDKIFEQYAKFIVGLERHILETIGFDFRGQYPQKLLIKMIRSLLRRDEARAFLPVAYDMSIDLYKTFAPVKQSTFTLVLALLELTASLTGVGQKEVQGLDPHLWHASRDCVLETMLDVLDLYTHFPKSTKNGTRYELQKIMDVKININKLMEKQKYPRFGTWCEKCKQELPDVAHPITPGSTTSPATSLSGGGPGKKITRTAEGSVRFLFDAGEARKERALIAEYFTEAVEKYEMEVEEIITPEEPRNARTNTNNQAYRNNSHHDHHGWAPYPSRHAHMDRQRGRKGHYY